MEFSIFGIGFVFYCSKWRKQWKYNLIPHITVVDVTDGLYRQNIVKIAWRLLALTWFSGTVHITVPVKRNPGEYKTAWDWPDWEK